MHATKAGRFVGDVRELYEHALRSCRSMGLRVDEGSCGKGAFDLTASETPRPALTFWRVRIRITAEKMGDDCDLVIRGESLPGSQFQPDHNASKVDALMGLLSEHPSTR